MLTQFYKYFNNYSLYAMERLDKRQTRTEKIGYKYARKIFDITFWKLYGYSPYDYQRNGDTNGKSE